MIRALVIDDEIMVAQWIAELLLETGKVHVEKIIHNPLEANDEIRRLKPDVVFLDIEMPEITGLELAEGISALERAPEIIFVTAYNKYAIEAFKVNALDYIMKPVNPKELNRVIEKIERRGFISSRDEKKMYIRVLGGFRVIIDDSKEIIKWSTSKCEELFGYMLFKKNKTVSKWEVIDLLWPDKDDKKGETNLRTTVCRLNQTFKKYGVKAKIKSEKNVYILQIEDLWIDTFLLENIEEKWEKINHEKKGIETFFEIYPGPLFKGYGYEWSQDAEAYYEMLFIQWGKDYVDQRMQREEDEILTYKILQYLISISPFNEDLHKRAMKIIFRIEGKKSLQTYYKKFKNAMIKEIMGEPKKELQELYIKLME
jgi:two-component system LytT family response regulator